MSPIERAARALCELDGNPPGATMDGKPLWQDYLPEVRAVFAAIREPSEGMLDAGFEFTADPCWKEDLAKAWQAMVDAAMDEQ